MTSQDYFIDDFVSKVLRQNGITIPNEFEIKKRHQKLMNSNRYFHNTENFNKNSGLMESVRQAPAEIPTLKLDNLDLEKILILQPTQKHDDTVPIIRYEAPETKLLPRQKRPKAYGKKVIGKGQMMDVYIDDFETSPPLASSATMYPLSSTSANSTFAPIHSYPLSNTSSSSGMPSSSSHSAVLPHSMSSTSTALPPPPSSFVAVPSKSTTPTPDFESMKHKMNKIFNYFWELDISDNRVSAAYFGRINDLNYKEFDMEKYFSDYINLTFIKDKLDHNQYFNYKEFLRDFEIMFTRILDSFPPDHPVINKTMELQRIFREKSAL